MNAKEILLRPLYFRPHQREEAYSVALTSFARRLPEIDSGKDWEAISQEIGPPEDLNSSEFGSPLTLQLSALNALLEAGEFRSSMDDDTPEGRLLKHEQHYWQRTAADMGITLAPATLSYAVAASTLMGAADEAEALATLGRIPTLADQKADVRLAVALWLRDLYPTVDGKYWGALQPDLIGEHHIGTISESNPDLVGHLLDGSSQGQAYRALTALARFSERYPSLQREIDGAIADNLSSTGLVAVNLVLSAPDLKVIVDAITMAVRGARVRDLIDFARNFPQRPAMVVKVAENLSSLIADRLRSFAHMREDSIADDLFSHSDLIAALNRIDIYLSRDHRGEEMSRIVSGSERPSAELMRSDEVASLLSQATSLGNQAVSLSELGHHTEALDAIQESVGIYRQLVEIEPYNHEPNLSRLLNNLAVQFRRMGRYHDALIASAEAIEIYRGLARDRPDVFLVNLANSLTNQVNLFSYLGRREEAL
ncbi:tetratricopeptide repeat protein, partial [Herbidospora sp. RD11066]